MTVPSGQRLHTSQSVGLFWTSHQLVEETSESQHTTRKEPDIHAPAGFEPAFPVSDRVQTHPLDSAAIDFPSVQTDLKQFRCQIGVIMNQQVVCALRFEEHYLDTYALFTHLHFNNCLTQMYQ